MFSLMRLTFGNVMLILLEKPFRIISISVLSHRWSNCQIIRHSILITLSTSTVKYKWGVCTKNLPTKWTTMSWWQHTIGGRFNKRQSTCKMIWLLSSSNSGLSLATTMPSSWSMSPASEMEKLTMVILAVVSGGKWGFLRRVVTCNDGLG